MNQYTLLIITILIVGLVAIVIDRRWQASKAAEPNEGETEGSSSASKISSGFENLRDKMVGKKGELPQKFQSWAEQALTTNKEKSLKNWLMELSPEESAAFTKDLTAFCARQNLDLAWLVDQQLDKNNEALKAAKNIVVSYGLACQQAALAQEDFHAFETYQAMLQKPSGKVGRALNQELFAELVKQDMAPAITPEHFLSSEQERKDHVITSIQQAADKDPSKFNTILKQVIETVKNEENASESLADKMFKRVKRSKSVEEEPIADVAQEGQPVAAAAAAA